MDPAAERFEKIYQDHFDKIWRYVGRRAPDLDVAEIVTDVFTTLWQKLDEVPAERIEPWLYEATKYKIGNAIRARRSQPRVVRPRDGFDDVQVAEDHANAVVEEMGFEEALNCLPDEMDREILVLIAHEGLGPTEIAAVLGLKRSTVSMRMRRMREKLSHLRPTSASPPTDVSNDDEPEGRSAEGRKR